MEGIPFSSMERITSSKRLSRVKNTEGLERDGELHPLQKAFWEEHGLQCGYCTPGMLMAAYELLERNPCPTEEEVRKGISGNVCRCTGYVNIIKAIQSAGQRIAEQNKLPKDKSEVVPSGN